MSVGSRRARSTAAIRHPRNRPDLLGHAGRGEALAGFTSGDSITSTTCWVPGRADADRGGRGDLGHPLDPLFDPDRGDRPAAGEDHVTQPALHPEPTMIIEVPDVAGPVPAGIAGTGLLHHPEPVVAVLDVGGGHADLAGHPGALGEQPGRLAVLVQRAQPDRDPGQRPADAHAVARTGRFDLRQVDVGHRQHLGHAVRGVQLGVRDHGLGLTEQRGRHRGTGRHHQPHPGQGLAVPGLTGRRPWRPRCAAPPARRRPPWPRRRGPPRRAPSPSGCRARSRSCRERRRRRRAPGRTARTARRRRPAGRGR